MKLYQIKSGRYAGMYHVREYRGKGKYFHIGRYHTEQEARAAMEKSMNLHGISEKQLLKMTQQIMNMRVEAQRLSYSYGLPMPGIYNHLDKTEDLLRVLQQECARRSKLVLK
jgi:hypothetical protein